jgi:sterol desaturase/sphingolipid hydroxylase (fatty acid hydroxylase superfamily)
MIDYLEYFGLAYIPAFLIIDAFYRDRAYRTPRFWRLTGFVVSVVAVVTSMVVAAFWGSQLAGYSLFDGSGLGTWGGAALGVLIYEFLHYGYHRLAHEWHPLWRLGHQMHHAPEALDAWGAYYLHPIDVFFFTTWSALVFFPILGLTPEAGVLGAAFLGFNTMFQHTNLRTPRWLGYLIQRPESHVLHHQRGYHRNNYADLPVIDMLFGTFENPGNVDGIETGFYPGGSQELIRLLTFQDIASGPARTGEDTEIKIAA